MSHHDKPYRSEEISPAMSKLCQDQTLRDNWSHLVVSLNPDHFLILVSLLAPVLFLNGPLAAGPRLYPECVLNCRYPEHDMQIKNLRKTATASLSEGAGNKVFSALDIVEH